ncbi:MAG: hypothetical protein ACYDAE_15020 [Steroidobacteraceae bacterium]
MSKRELLIIAALAVVGFGLVLYFRDRPSRPPVSHPAQQAIPAPVVKAKANHVPPVPHVQVAQAKYSQKEYMRLRRLYPPTKPAANGPLPESNLKLLANATKMALNEQKDWPLVKNVIYGKASAVENALDTGVSADTEVFLLNPYNSNVSLLDLAIMAGQRDVITLLLNHQASVTPEQILAPDGKDFPELAPLPEAAQFAEDDVVRLLLEHGANVEQRNDIGTNQDTALAAAVNGVNVSTVYLLLSDRANVSSALGPDDTVPEAFARSVRSPSMIALRGLLVAQGAKMPSTQ